MSLFLLFCVVLLGLLLNDLSGSKRKSYWSSHAKSPTDFGIHDKWPKYEFGWQWDKMSKHSSTQLAVQTQLILQALSNVCILLRLVVSCSWNLCSHWYCAQRFVGLWCAPCVIVLSSLSGTGLLCARAWGLCVIVCVCVCMCVLVCFVCVCVCLAEKILAGIVVISDIPFLSRVCCRCVCVYLMYVATTTKTQKHRRNFC